jgi:hypothetical protein
MDENQFLPEMLGHKNNLIQKKRVASTRVENDLVSQAAAAYEKYISDIDYESISQGITDSSVEALAIYLALAKRLERSERLFNWRSDYASSVVPEFLYRCLHHILNDRQLRPVFSKKHSVVELALSGVGGCDWNVRRKDQDLAIGLTSGSVAVGGVETPFLVPVIVFEVKTNIDINKLNGLDFSAQRLKRTFPNARYCLATETIDFSLRDNYASGSIDEVYVLRKQLRSQARRTLQPLVPDVFAVLFEDVVSWVERASLVRVHVYDRLQHGKLIHVEL